MKKFLLISMLLCSFNVLLFAQDHSFVPDTVYNTFTSTHPNATVVKWTMENDYYKVIFQEGSSVQALVYKKEGNLVKVENQLQTNDFPPAIARYYETHYPDKSKYVIWGSKAQDGTYTFYSDVDNNTLYFDDKGNFIRSEKKVSSVKY